MLAALPQEDRAATADRPFTSSHIRRRAPMSWAKANEKRKENKLPALKPIGLHEARHTFVSMMAAAGIPLENIGDYVGHSTVYMTDRYRHLVEGQRAENLRRFDEYLARADSTGRIEQLGGLSQPTGPSLSE